MRCRSLNPTQKFASRIFEVLLLDLFHNVRFNDIADLDVVVLFEAQAALVALRDFLDGVLEALERGEVTLVDEMPSRTIRTSHARWILPSVT